MKDVSTVVQDTELSHTPRFVLKFSMWMNTIQRLALGIQKIDPGNTQITSRVSGDGWIITSPKVDLDLVLTAYDIVCPVTVTGKSERTVELKRVFFVEICEDRDGL